VKKMASFILAGAVCSPGAAATSAGEDKPKQVPLYTNDDLARVAPLREQTGGSMPAPPLSPPPTKDEERARAAQEDHWRREAERLRTRLEPWRERVAALREQIEERRRLPNVRYNDPRLQSMQRRLAAVEARIRDAEDHLHERARRAGAWPSWLR
jgi:hypothetical protein